MNEYILGISAFYHDSAAALIKGEEIIAASQEERFSRLKHDASLPVKAINFCLQYAGISARDLSAIVYYESPELKSDRQTQSFAQEAPRGLFNFVRTGRRALTRSVHPIDRIADHFAKLDSGVDWKERIVTGEHHLSHAASAYYPSPFSKATIITVDGVGEWDTTTICAGSNNLIERISSIAFPHSLGLLYSAFTSYCGFKVNDGEYKLMGLAPYGVPKFANLIRSNMIDVKSDGSFCLDLSYFDYLVGTRMYSPRFVDLMGVPARQPDDPITQHHMDVAASIQSVLESIVLELVRYGVQRVGSRNLCLAGGVALNCVANGKILRSGLIDHLWVQPAASDSGGALGAAQQHYYGTLERPRMPLYPDAMKSSRLGPSYSQSEIESALNSLGAKFEILTDEQVIEKTSDSLAAGDVVGWYDGRMEFGPRALGGRSILGDPRRTDMQRTLNLKVKFRESFRPFAPIVLAEHARDWFEIDHESPYMLIVAPVDESKRLKLDPERADVSGFDKLSIPRSLIPAVTHVDNSARVQTVDRMRNPYLYSLLEAFNRKTGVPVLVNTSFNVNNEPIVCSPEDAYRCFMQTHIDTLVVGKCFLKRLEQPTYVDTRAMSSAMSLPQQPSDFLYTLY